MAHLRLISHRQFCLFTGCVVALISLPETSAEVPRDSLRRTAIVQAVQRAIPAVVNIHGQKTVDSSSAAGDRNRRVNGMGTGVVIDERGFILTNFHVIEGVRPIQVTLHDERTYTATLVARDPHTDLAVIKVATNHALPLISIGTSQDLMPGESVIAIGNAFGYHHTVTRGIISSLQRSVEVTDSQRYYDLIQTDASINPGNSGGPLLNVDGDMIGINVAVRVGADGIAFAIPVDRAMEVAATLMATEQMAGVWHGMQGRSLQENGQWFYEIERVTPGSPAAECGLQRGDRIVRIGHTSVHRQLDVERALLRYSPGAEASVGVMRKDREVPIQLVVANLPDVSTSSQLPRVIWSRIGLRLSAVTNREIPALGSQYQGGLRVLKVRDGSPAARSGLRAGDVLFGLIEWETASLSDIDYILARLDPLDAKPMPFYFVRDQETRSGQLVLSRR